MNSVRKFLVLFVGLVAFGTANIALAGAVNTKNGIAVKGYDVVAYHSLQPSDKAVKGNSAFTSTHEGAVYQFSSAANKATFDTDPAKYAPQYGGYCAYALAKNGDKVKVSPHAWSIENGKLYLNYNKTVRGFWNEDRAGYIAKADANWVTAKQK